MEFLLVPYSNFIKFDVILYFFIYIFLIVTNNDEKDYISSNWSNMEYIFIKARLSFVKVLPTFGRQGER